MMTALLVAAVAATSVNMDIGTPLEKAERAGCTNAAKGATTVGIEGGDFKYRADVDIKAADLIAATYRKAHGRKGARVKQPQGLTCDGAVPKLSHRVVRTDATGLRHKLSQALCAAILNANYNIDQITIDEWAWQYDAFAKAERSARKKTHAGGTVPTSAAVRKSCPRP